MMDMLQDPFAQVIAEEADRIETERKQREDEYRLQREERVSRARQRAALVKELVAAAQTALTLALKKSDALDQLVQRHPYFFRITSYDYGWVIWKACFGEPNVIALCLEKETSTVGVYYKRITENVYQPVHDEMMLAQLPENGVAALKKLAEGGPELARIIARAILGVGPAL